MPESQPTELHERWKAHRPPAAVPTALARLIAMARAGTAPDRMEQEVRLVLASWQADPDARAMQVAIRADLLVDHLRAGCARLAEDVDAMDTGDTSGLAPARRALAALKAARDELIRHCGEMP